MAEFIGGLFTAKAGIERVNIIGLIVMALGVILTLSAKRAAQMLPENKRNHGYIAFKLASVLICIAGFVIAIF